MVSGCPAVFSPAPEQLLLAKLLGAVLVDAIRTQGPDFSPYGFPVRSDIPRRVAYFPNDLAGSPHDRSGVCRADGLVPDLPRVNQGPP